MAQIKTLNINNDYLKTDDSEQYTSNTIPAIDIRNGGQWGALPLIGGVDNDTSINDWMHEQQYMKRDLIPIVISVPKMFDLLPNTDAWKQAVKAMVEVHAKTIEGLNSSLTVTTSEHDLGLSGAKYKEVTNVTRESSDVTITVEEKNGNPFEILLDVWIRYGLLDPDLKAPLITRIVDEGLLPSTWSAEWTTMSVIFIEPDILLRKPVHAWLVSNMFPMGNPNITGKKDKSAGRESKSMSINLGGFAVPHTNKRVMKLATKILNNLKLWNLDPEMILLPSDTVDASLAEVEGTGIYYDGVKGADGVSATA